MIRVLSLLSLLLAGCAPASVVAPYADAEHGRPVVMLDTGRVAVIDTGASLTVVDDGTAEKLWPDARTLEVGGILSLSGRVIAARMIAAPITLHSLTSGGTIDLGPGQVAVVPHVETVVIGMTHLRQTEIRSDGAGLRLHLPSRRR